MSQYSNIEEQNDFYFNGFVNKEIKESNSFTSLLNFIKDSDAYDLSKSNYYSESYKQTYDLNKELIVKNKFFIEFLFQQDIPKYLERITGHPLYLGDITLRKTYLKEKSYMDWHRDTYIKNSKTVGRTPPVIKIIFYPKINENESSELEIIKGSHNLYFKNIYIERLQRILSKKIKIKSSNKKLLIFNSAMLHAAKTPSDEGSFRLIYNFCSNIQLSQFSRTKSIQDEYKSNL